MPCGNPAIQWNLHFSVICEVDEAGYPTGNYKLFFTGGETGVCTWSNFEFGRDEDDFTVVITKCWGSDGEVDITFTYSHEMCGEVGEICLTDAPMTKTFVFRVHT